MRFLVDDQLPPALARFLSAEGHKNSDFSAMRAADPDGPVVVWLRMGNTRKPALLGRMKATLPTIIRLIEGGERLVEVR